MWLGWRSIRAPLLLSRIGPRVRAPTARSMARPTAVNGAGRSEGTEAHGCFKIVLGSALAVPGLPGRDVVSRSGIGSADLIMK